jgi:hypothetical protein
MANEFFDDASLDSMQKALRLIIGDLETLRARTHDFSKQRMRKRLEGVQNDLGTIIKTLPSSPETGDTQSQGNANGPRA